MQQKGRLFDWLVSNAATVPIQWELQLIFKGPGDCLVLYVSAFKEPPNSNKVPPVRSVTQCLLILKNFARYHARQKCVMVVIYFVGLSGVRMVVPCVRVMAWEVCVCVDGSKHV